MSYAEVAVNSPMARRRTFSYAIPPAKKVSMGQAVWVPFGPRILQGIVLELSDIPQVEETREIIDIIDPEPVLSPIQITLARWMSDRYLAPIFDSTALMLPPGFERRAVAFIHSAPRSAESLSISLTPQQGMVLRLLEQRGRVRVEEIEKAIGKKRATVVIRQLLGKGLAIKTYELERVRVKPKVISRLHLAVNASEAQKKAYHLRQRGASKQAALLELLASESSPIPYSEVRKRISCSPATVKALGRRGLLSIEEIEVRRDPLSHLSFALSIPPTLTAAQEAACNIIKTSLTRSAIGAITKPTEVFLLHGVTGSGKTEVYLQSLAQAIAAGKRGIVLVPEISLTPQTIERFASRFPQRVAVLHSKLSLGEQFDEWQRIREGAFDVVIGSRGAIFSPQPDLGLIVIDEEHEWTYKQQEQAPRYHARDIAIKLAELTGAVVILGSATPAVESFHRAQIGEYRLLQLPSRVTPYNGSSLPQVEVVDLREELKAGNRSIFSRALRKAIDSALSSGEQVILFLNRRGGATFVQCRNCGFVLRCRRCDVSLTYHTIGNVLVCHQCNYKTIAPEFCPQCWSRHIRFLGIGTQRVEEEAASTFPGARLLRWDRDVTRGKHSHEEILSRFIAHEADILVGTQMLAKGLDLPLVTLVGVVNADTALYLPDFRAGERTFQILTQVAGRAGRGVRGGKVIVQTYTPENYAVRAAAEHDYATFYQREISYRREYRIPPFSRLIRLTYSHTSLESCQKEADRMSRLLIDEKDSRGISDISLVGPSPAFIQRLRGRFRWQILVRGKEPSQLLEGLPIPQGWTIDIDPVGL